MENTETTRSGLSSALLLPWMCSQLSNQGVEENGDAQGQEHC